MDLVPATNQAAILRAVGLDPDLPQTHALLLIAQKYDLDPLLGHIFIVPTKQGPRPYISRDAQLHIAHRSGMFDGMQTKITIEGKVVYATCEVYRKDMRAPFSFTGSCEIPDPKGRDPKMMAIARAERNALKRAFDIQVDVYDPDEPKATVTSIDRIAPVALPEYHRPAETPSEAGTLQVAPGVEAPPAAGEPVGEEPPPAPQDSPRTLKLAARMAALDFSPEKRREYLSQLTNGRTEDLGALTDEEAGSLLLALREMERSRA